MVLADPRLVIVQLIDVLQQLHVALQRERGVLSQVVERRKENAAAQVAHGLASWGYWPVGYSGTQAGGTRPCPSASTTASPSSPAPVPVSVARTPCCWPAGAPRWW